MADKEQLSKRKTVTDIAESYVACRIITGQELTLRDVLIDWLILRYSYSIGEAQKAANLAIDALKLMKEVCPG